jgi:hypothetical protein
MRERLEELVGSNGTSENRKSCFEAVCVIAQHQIENNRPLYDVLIDDGIMMED